jgi:hypothetical protein
MSLDRFRTYVATQYQKVLGKALQTSVTEAAEGPVYSEANGQAWLLDPEVGLALRIVPYTKAEQELNPSIQEGLSTATLLQPRAGLTPSKVIHGESGKLEFFWLVDNPSLGESWQAAIAEIRKQSGFSEEIGLDAILATDSNDFSASCAAHGLPQLIASYEAATRHGMDGDALMGFRQ